MRDVLIHNMELPEKDGLLSINIWPNGSVTIAMDLECKPVARAVELPPHGDLIDRDALGEFPFNMSFCDGYEADEWVQNAPAIVPASKSKEETA